MARNRYDVAIVGAGLSGTLVAVQLLLQAEMPLRVALLERERPFGQGLAYSTPSPSHRLNVPAGRMSAFAGDMGHFLRWLRETEPAAEAHDFVTRGRYGEYLASLLDVTQARVPGSLERLRADVRELDRGTGARLGVGLGDGSWIDADRVVLAMGNLDPLDPPCATQALVRSDRYARNPWSPEATAGLAPRDPVLLVGSGLTAIDVALSLRDAGHRGTIHAISRHGLLPQTHVQTQPWELRRDLFALPPTARALLHALREEAAVAGSGGSNWRAVMDAIRPHTIALWQRLPRAERRRFLRHARTYWETHRHRMAPEVGAEVRELLASGRLRVRAAHLVSLDLGRNGVEAILRPRGEHRTERLAIARVLNCTGPSVNVRRTTDPLLAHLHAGGWIRPHPLGLGLCSDVDGAVIDAAGRPARDLFAIGPLRRGDLWETTAAPEIRVQAERLAARLVADLAASRPAQLHG